MSADSVVISPALVLQNGRACSSIAMPSEPALYTQPLESFKATSSAIIVVGSFASAFSVYVIQRGVLAISGSLDVITGQRQGNYDGLDFAYATTSLLAPTLLAFLSLIISALALARQRAWRLYVDAGGAGDLPPWTTGSGDEPVCARLRSWIKAVAALPSIALLVHGCAGVRVLQMGISEALQRSATGQIPQQGNGALVPEPNIWIPAGVAMILVTIAISRGVRELWRANFFFSLSTPSVPPVNVQTSTGASTDVNPPAQLAVP